ncbi:MAG: 3-phosphoserine/phosphohydroxythreonine transaminase [Planctomycetota bacterium]
MSQRIYNFSAGPAMLPTEVLEASAAALVDYQGTGVGIAEVSHRGAAFTAVIAEARERCKRLLGLGDSHEVLFLQGGATQQFDLIPMNFLRGHADYAIAGQWGKKAYQGGKRYGDARVAADSGASNYDHVTPLADWQLSADADYLHICSNNTIFGTRTSEWPSHSCLIADMSSEIMSRQIDAASFGMIYAGAQKNLGPSGVVLAIIRKDLLERCPEDLAPIFNYRKHAEADSCLNTPPTFGIYILLETFRWLERWGGLEAMQALNELKAKLIYDAIDTSGGFYRGTVSNKADRSIMNITYVLPDEELTKRFLKGAEERGMVALKGYRSVGGVRASVYNAMPKEGCQALADFMQEFQAANG